MAETMHTNGIYAPHHGYGGIDQSHNAPAFQGNAQAFTQGPPSSNTPATTASSQSDIPKDEVGWYFVEQYYTTLSRTPEKLYLYYNKRSQYVSGNETDKVQVCVGQRAINDRIKELDFQDCKVRITNVDSQASDINIVIQVIGEISNKSQPHRKFTQTFVLAAQTNGYFVLNDIFRYIIEEEEEQEVATEQPAKQPEEVQQVPAAESGYQEPAPTAEEAEPKTLTSSSDATAVEHDAQVVDKEIEEKLVKVQPEAEESAPSTNGVAAEEDPLIEQAKEAPAVEQPAAEEPAAAETAAPLEQTDSRVQPEAPKSPEQTPVASPPKQTPAQPAAPPKPALPKTWANLAAAANRGVATPQAPAAAQSQTKSITPSAPKTTSSPAQPPVPASSAPNAPAMPPTGPSSQTQRDASPAANSQDEWTAVGGSHNRQQSRQVNGGQPDTAANTRGYIKGVGENVKAPELKEALQKCGEVTFFDVNRAKNCAFVDFRTPEAYQTAVSTSPHTVNGQQLFVVERRVGGPGFVQRGGFQGGRGGRGSFRGNDRGGFAPRGRGAPRGGRGGAAPAGPAGQSA